MAHTIDPTTLAPPVGAPASEGWVRHAPEVVLAVAACVLDAWSLSQNGWGNLYYAASVRSMTSSWHAFLYGSFDVGGFITTDKPPLAQWVMAASAKVFGYSSWSLLLPSAIAGALSVWLLTITVRRVWGRTAGLVAGIVLALTPMAFAVSRSTNPDAILVLTLVAAVWATERAIASGRWRWSVAAGAFVGLGFLTKMLAAAVVLPAVAIGLVLGLARREGARREAVRRSGHVVAVGVAFLVVSFSWVALIDLSSDAPYAGGSEDGTAWDLVWGYNGFGRVFGDSGPGGGGGPGAGQGPFGNGVSAGNVVQQFGGDPGIGRLFNFSIGDQVMWLSAIAGVALVAGAVVAVRRRRLDARAGSVAVFGTWALTGFALFSFSSGIFHNYYVSAMAPALAALVGIGAAHVLAGGRRAKLVAAAAVLANGGVQLLFLRRVDAFQWLRVAVPVASVVFAAALVVWAYQPVLDRRRVLVLGGGLGACLLAPAMWIGSGLTHAQNGSFPDARPAEAGESSPGFGVAGGPGTDAIDSAMLDELTAMTTTETWVLAVGSAQEASSAMIRGYPMLAMGGFSGGDPAMTGERLADLVRTNHLRFIAGSGAGGPGAGGRGGPGGRGSAAATWAAAVCEPVEFESPTTLTVYDCQGKADELLDASRTTPVGTGGGVPGGGQFPGGGQLPGGGQFPGGGAGEVPEGLLDCLAEQGLTDPPLLPDGRPDLTDPATREAVFACTGALPQP